MKTDDGPYDVATVRVTTHNLSDLLWRLREHDEFPSTPLEAVGAWLYAHADGTEQERLRLLELMRLGIKVGPNGGTTITKRPAESALT